MSEEIYDIHIVVKETGEVIKADESSWCIKTTVEPGRVWLYRFEDMKGQSFPDYDYDDPTLHVEKLDGSLQISITGYSSSFHSDIYAYDRVLWLDAGGVERNHLGESLIVILPELPPTAPPPVAPPTPVAPPLPPVAPPVVPPPVEPAPPEWRPVTDPLDKIIAKLWDIKDEIRPITIKANTYTVSNINLSIARPSFQTFNVRGFAMTIYKCTGEMEVALGDLATDGIPIEPMVYPQMLVIDRMDFETFFVKNSAQPGKEATILVWRRT